MEGRKEKVFVSQNYRFREELWRVREGVKNGELRPDIDVEAILLSINQLCFSYFSNIHTFAEILQTDLASQKEIESRADHVAQLLLSYLK